VPGIDHDTGCLEFADPPASAIFRGVRFGTLFAIPANSWCANGDSEAVESVRSVTDFPELAKPWQIRGLRFMSARQSDALTVEMPSVVSEGFAGAVWRYRWILILTLFLGGGVGAALASRFSPAFAASARLTFHQNSGIHQVPLTAAYIQSQAELITSGPVLNTACVALQKLDLKTFKSSSDLFGALKHELRTDAGLGGETLSVSFHGPVAADNRIIVDTVVAAYCRYLAEHPALSVDATVVAETIPMESPIHSSSRTIAVGAALGLTLGFALSIGLIAMDQRLRLPVQIDRLLRLPVIGVIPRLPGKPALAACALTTHTNPMSAFAEAARTVRSAVFFAGRATSARTIVITSAGKDDGRSTFASNLAIAMAQAGSLTLLLDADLRNPEVAEIFEIARSTGLSDVLSGKAELDRAITRTAVERLEVLPSGIAPPNPAEMLNSGAFSNLIEQLNSRYQCIILDSPPVSRDADARILAAMADLTVFVVRAGSTRRNTADHALEQLLSVGARILGAVLNDVTRVKPVQRSRGILRFVETPLEQAGQTGVNPPMGAASFRSGAVPARSASVTQKQRMESRLMPEVEVVE